MTIREELRKLLPSAQPQVDLIADNVSEEVRQSLGVCEAPQSQPQAMSYAATAQPYAPLHAHVKRPYCPGSATSRHDRRRHTVHPLVSATLPEKLRCGVPPTPDLSATTEEKLATLTATASTVTWVSMASP